MKQKEFSGIVKLSNEQYAELVANGSLTVGDKTIQYDPFTIYITPDTLAKVAKSGLYQDLEGKPTKLSDFENDAGFITASEVPDGGEPQVFNKTQFMEFLKTFPEYISLEIKILQTGILNYYAGSRFQFLTKKRMIRHSASGLQTMFYQFSSAPDLAYATVSPVALDTMLIYARKDLTAGSSFDFYVYNISVGDTITKTDLTSSITDTNVQFIVRSLD